MNVGDAFGTRETVEIKRHARTALVRTKKQRGGSSGGGIVGRHFLHAIQVCHEKRRLVPGNFVNGSVGV